MADERPHQPAPNQLERLNAAIEESRRTVALSRETSERVWTSITATRLAVERSSARRAAALGLPVPGLSEATD